MCFTEQYAVIPEGCLASNKDTHLVKETSPCAAAIFLSMIRNKEAGGDLAQMEITLCDEKEWVKVDCFHGKLETRALQTEAPYCPVCTGEKTLAQALTAADDESTDYAILPNGTILYNTDDTSRLPSYLQHRIFSTEDKLEFDSFRLKRRANDKLRYIPARDFKPTKLWGDPEKNRKLKICVAIFLNVCHATDKELEEAGDLESWLVANWDKE